MSVIVKGNEIVLTGTVGGDPWWDDDCFSQTDVINALAQVGRDTDVTVRVNSGGGIATEGAAIHATFAAHKGKVNMVVEGWAASAASLFVMSGHTITMAPGSLLMIHDPAAPVWGTCDDHRRAAEALDTMGNVYAQVYADRCKKPVAEVRQLMRAETWLGPAEAVAEGFADAASAEDRAPVEPVAFAQIRSYARAPDPITALAKARGWGARAAHPAATSAASPHATMEAPVSTPPSPTAVPPAPTSPHPQTPPPADGPADPVLVAEACARAGYAELTAPLLKAQATMTAVTARLEEARAIADAGTRLRQPVLAKGLILGGVSLEMAQGLLTDAAAARDEQVITDTTRSTMQAQDGGWGGAVAKLK